MAKENITVTHLPRIYQYNSYGGRLVQIYRGPGLRRPADLYNLSCRYLTINLRTEAYEKLPVKN